MNHEDSFKDWLPNNGVSADSTISYVSYITSIEKARGISIDELLEKGVVETLNDINGKKIPGKSEKTLSNYRYAVQKYWDFLHAK